MGRPHHQTQSGALQKHNEAVHSNSSALDGSAIKCCTHATAQCSRSSCSSTKKQHITQFTVSQVSSTAAWCCQALDSAGAASRSHSCYTYHMQCDWTQLAQHTMERCAVCGTMASCTCPHDCAVYVKMGTCTCKQTGLHCASRTPICRHCP